MVLPLSIHDQLRQEFTNSPYGLTVDDLLAKAEAFVYRDADCSEVDGQKIYSLTINNKVTSLAEQYKN